MELEKYLRDRRELAVAFSGGTDSAYLFSAAGRWCERVRAYMVKTPFQPSFELEDAERLGRELGCGVELISFDVLSAPGVAENPPDRCYLCKRAIFTLIWERARADGFSAVADGTNASDDLTDRPGMRAIRELGVISPLLECGITKDEVRRQSREAGLFTWNKPSYSCLATRLAPGETITAEKLALVEKAESALMGMGFSDFRVRLSAGSARLEMTARQLDEAFLRREEITRALEGLFKNVSLDLKARK